jgi:formamidopyrimidine-DNA glycosylase
MGKQKEAEGEQMRLIDADALYKDICDSINQMTAIGIAVDGDWMWAKLNNALVNAQTIEERKKGKWVVDKKRFGDDEYHCNQCGAILEGDALVRRNNYYCYHCGADMWGI